jgi:hypothetical protein
LGDKAGMKQCVEAAKKVARNLPRADSFLTIAEMQIAIDDREGAKESVQAAKAIAAKTHVDDLDHRPGIARMLAALGNVTEANAVLDGVEDGVGKTNAYEEIAIAQAGKSDFAGAKTTLAVISKAHDANRHATEARVAIAEAEAGHVRDAKATIRRIGDHRWQAIALRHVGGLQVDSSDLAGATATVEEIQTLGSVAQPPKDNDVMERRVTSTLCAATLHWEIAKGYADVGDEAAARRSLS